MNWLVLKNRRHEGPFAEDALREFVRAGRFKAEDYAITVAQSEKGDFDYVSLRKILGLPEDAIPTIPPVAPPRKPVTVAPKKLPTPPPVMAASVSTSNPLAPQRGRVFPWKPLLGVVVAGIAAIAFSSYKPTDAPTLGGAPKRAVGSVEGPRSVPRAPENLVRERPARAAEHVLRVPKISDEVSRYGGNAAPNSVNLPAGPLDPVAAAAIAAGVAEAPTEPSPLPIVNEVDAANPERSLASPPEGQYYPPPYVSNEAQPR